jgi:hypothetical protein
MEERWIFAVEDTGIGGLSIDWTNLQEVVDPSQWRIGMPPVSRTAGIMILVQ